MKSNKSILVVLKEREKWPWVRKANLGSQRVKIMENEKCSLKRRCTEETTRLNQLNPWSKNRYLVDTTNRFGQFVQSTERLACRHPDKNLFVGQIHFFVDYTNLVRLTQIGEIQSTQNLWLM